MADRAGWNFKACRVLLTEERGGRVTVRVDVKPLHADWNGTHRILVRTIQAPGPLESIDDVYAALLELLAEPPLPSGHTLDG